MDRFKAEDQVMIDGNNDATEAAYALLMARALIMADEYVDVEPMPENVKNALTALVHAAQHVYPNAEPIALVYLPTEPLPKSRIS